MSGQYSKGLEGPANCGGLHRFFVATDAATDSGRVIVFLVCTACGEGKKVEFEVANATAVTLKR